VLAARHKFTGARVAVKMVRKDLGIDPEIEARFLAEARVPEAIGHRGVVKTLDAGKTPEGEIYLAMELLVGNSLRAQMQKGPLTLGAIRRIGMELLDVLAAAHARGIVHRDIKPENVFLVAPDGAVKLLDFGITKLLTSGQSLLPRTQAGVVLGTVAYMAPEQLADARGVDARADLWAVGVMLYELLSGRRPYRGTTVEDLLRALVHDEPDPIRAALPTAAPDLEAFFARALAREPAKRFANAVEMAQAFARLSMLAPSMTPPAGMYGVTPSSGTPGVTPSAPMPPVTPPAGVYGVTMASVHPNAAIGMARPDEVRPGEELPRRRGGAESAETGSAPPSASSAPLRLRGNSGTRMPWLLAVIGVAAAIAGTALFFHVRNGSPAQQQPAPPPPQIVVMTPPPQAPSAPPSPAAGSATVVEPPVKTIKPRAGSAVGSASTPTGPTPLDPYAGNSAPAAPLDFCAASCRTLASCHLGSRTCEADCARPGSVHDCLAQAQGDCNRFAACMFAGYCSQLPIGTHSCSEAMDCESSCGGDQVCVCQCIQGLAPSHAAALLGLRGCAAPCRGNTACIAKNCDAQIKHCRAQ
jgi:serine/threonine-protein kinase